MSLWCAIRSFWHLCKYEYSGQLLYTNRGNLTDSNSIYAYYLSHLQGHTHPIYIEKLFWGIIFHKNRLILSHTAHFLLKISQPLHKSCFTKGPFSSGQDIYVLGYSNASFVALPLSISFSNSSVCWSKTRLNICQNHETSQLPPPVPQVLNHLKSQLFDLTTKRADGRCFFNHPMFPLATVKRFTSLPLLPKHQSSQPSLTDKSLLIFSYLACNSNITIFLDTSH